MQSARADDPDVRWYLRRFAGNREALDRVVCHGLSIPEKARRLAGELRRCRSCRSYEAVLNRMTSVIASVNYFPQPMVLVVDHIEIGLIDKRLEIEDDGHERGEKPWQGLYMDRNAVIWIARLNNINGRTWPWWEILVTYCHELVHHLDICVWQVTDHRVAFYYRVTNLVEQLIAVQQREVHERYAVQKSLPPTAIHRAIRAAFVQNEGEIHEREMAGGSCGR